MTDIMGILREAFELELQPWQEEKVIKALALTYEPPNRYERLHSVILRRVEHLYELAESLGCLDRLELRIREAEPWGRREYLRNPDILLHLFYEKGTDNCILTDEDMYALAKKG